MPDVWTNAPESQKLVVMGPKDSGKTTWASVFLGTIRRKFIASVIQENQFSCAMIDEDTQIIFLDEWAERTLQSDMAKLVLQGGYMVSAVKHGKPKILDNRCPFYITTNEVPYFGNDEENVQRRIRVFKTKSLESCLTNVDRWIRDNPMDCIVWIAQEIEENIELVDVDERWYERNPPIGNDVAVTERGIFTGVDLANAAESVIFDIEKVKSMSKEEILSVFKIENKIKTPQDLMHDSFRDAAKSALEKGRNKKEEEAIREKELEPYRQTHSSDDNDSLPNTLNKQTIAYHRAVRRQIENEFYKDNLSSVHVLSHRRKQSMKL